MSNYEQIEDLPKSITRRMPVEAQQLYLAAFRRKRERMKMDGGTDEERISAAAHEAGLFAVQQQFEQDEAGRWRQAPIGEDMDPDNMNFIERGEK